MKKILVLMSFFLFIGTLPALAADVPMMTKEELKAKIGTAGITILDVRAGRDWSSSEFKIKGAIRASGKDYDKWSKDYNRDQTLILYCA